MSGSKSEDEMTGDELRREALERGFTLDDSLANAPVFPALSQDSSTEGTEMRRSG
jgi:hypothetical protein